MVGWIGLVGRLAGWFDCLLSLVCSVNCFVGLADLGRWCELVGWLVGGSLIDCLVGLVDWLCVFLFVWLFHLVG